jgi:hypothetical protein
MTACSLKEEEVWRESLRSCIAAEGLVGVESGSTCQNGMTFLALQMRPIFTIFAQDTCRKRISVHRAATMGPKHAMTQLILKNTLAQKAQPASASAKNLPVARSLSLLSTGHIPVLAPNRSERIRLEAALSDVWTKDMIPYPGMPSRRAEHTIRASANSVMRKLSMASIASNFSKRSVSHSSLSLVQPEEGIHYGIPTAPYFRPQVIGMKRRGAAVVDFHSAPRAFLPADFEVQSKTPRRRRRTSTLTRTILQDGRNSFARHDSGTESQDTGGQVERVDSRNASCQSIKTEMVELETEQLSEKAAVGTKATPENPVMMSGNTVKTAVKSKIRLLKFWAGM